ncbi:hypothetical protein ASG43_09885 [Aureimonas sp. Leaf454]|uniref:SRPBCC family protein n=1 Tax=Aureimonas sp. Leaf454 TaxID=1736381 RepID=UPI0006F4A3B2|nr:SRPBCC family protein [Aureimonas sp. Leaf454]KQT47421.1 hypothetical protein ASG43_09885 [Aureimonas sp. Leaf454]
MNRFLLAVLLLLLPASALAQHAPTRAKLTETIEVAASPETVWERVKNFDDLSWNPLVASVDTVPGNVLDTARLVTLKTGGEMAETLYRFDEEKHMFATLVPHMDLKVLPVSTYSSYLTVKPGKAPGTALVEWRAAFYRGWPNNDPPPELNEAAGIKAVGAYVREALAGLKSTVEHGS